MVSLFSSLILGFLYRRAPYSRVLLECFTTKSTLALACRLGRCHATRRYPFTGGEAQGRG